MDNLIKEYAKLIGTYNNELVLSIAEKCAKKGRGDIIEAKIEAYKDIQGLTHPESDELIYRKIKELEQLKKGEL